MTVLKTSTPVALTIAGFDPSGGAGVLADARTFSAYGLDAAAAITSLTFQNESQFFGALHSSAETVRAQVEPLLRQGAVVCAKTGMLPTREVVMAVAGLFREGTLPEPVVDPVLMSSSGERLMDEEAVEVLIEELFSVCRVVTPNIPEAERLTGLTINSESQMREAAQQIRKLGARAVLIKGGHLRQEAGRQQAPRGRRQGAEPVNYSTVSTDVLDDDGQVSVFNEKRVEGVELHGSGCILSAAIAAGLGKGMTLEASVARAKSFVSASFAQKLNSRSEPA